MKLPFKKLSPNAITPTRSHAHDAGLDFYASSIDCSQNHNNRITYGTGIAVLIPQGYVGLMFPRSSIRDKCQILSNSVGVIDTGYTGEISFTFRGLPSSNQREYAVGDKIGQLVIVPIPEVELIEFDELPETERAANGFGSTGA